MYRILNLYYKPKIFLFKVVFEIMNNINLNKFVNIGTVKPVYNDHPRDPKLVAVVDRWSLLGVNFML